MGKASSMWGKTTGKVGGLVYASSGGEQIVREYNPNVANPSTTAQVDQRARMKLMSQISASVAQSLAFTKTGLISARNKFVKRNFENTYALNGVAQCSYENLQLTEGNLGLPAISMQAFINDGQRVLLGGFASAPAANVSRVVWSFFNKTEEGKLSFVSSVIVSQRLDTSIGKYFVFDEIPVPDGDIVVFGYGMIDTSESATARYGELNVVTGSDLAKLIATRSISFSDYQFTQTRGATMGADNVPVTPTEAGKVRIFATALGDGGTVSGGGSYDVGASVTLTATAASGYSFRAWLKNGTSQVVSTSNPYTFTAETQVDLIAAFDFEGNESL